MPNDKRAIRGPMFYPLHLLLDKPAEKQNVVHIGKLQAWFLLEHLVNTPTVRA